MRYRFVSVLRNEHYSDFVGEMENHLITGEDWQKPAIQYLSRFDEGQGDWSPIPAWWAWDANFQVWHDGRCYVISINLSKRYIMLTELSEDIRLWAGV